MAGGTTVSSRLGTINNDGVFGGGTIGYNYQTGAFVFGVEADFGGAGLTSDWNNGVGCWQCRYFCMSKNDANFYADVTGRLGYAAGPALFYVKGGWAFLDTNFTIDGCCNGGLTPGRLATTTGSMDGPSAAVSNICGARLGA